MAKKRKNKQQNRRKTAQTNTSRPDPQAFDPPMLDPRAMEKELADLTKWLNEQEFNTSAEMEAFLEQTDPSATPPPSAPRTPLEEAQMVMYEAWEATSKRRRVQLARKALSISEDCADAYVLLAEETARGPKQAKELYEAGVKAGERALGADAFEEYEKEGIFWGVLETRPYMRAREGLALCLWTLGHRQAAIAHYQEMLRLNPNDNQGIRDMLLPCLLTEGMDQEAEALLTAYKDDASAMWQYTRGLFTFRKEGAGRNADGQLRQALEFNPHVPDYLLGHKKLFRQLPPYMGLGDESEAMHYTVAMQQIWQQEAGALEWLREVSAQTA